MADIQVANTDADLSGNTVVTEENAYTITGLHTFSRSTSAPFACVSGAAVVAYLDSDKLDGQEGAYYLAAANATGTLAVNRGGTGAATFTDGGLLLGSGTSAIPALGVATNGQIPIGDGSGDPQLATITGTANEISVANGAASITIGMPDDVTIGGDLVVSGTGPHAMGAVVNDFTRLQLDGAFTSGGASTAMYGMHTAGVLTGHSADSDALVGTKLDNSIVTAGSSTTVAQLWVVEPTITVGAGSVTNSATVYIESAASEATNDYALWVDAGATQLDGTLTVGSTAADAIDVGGGINAGTGNVALVGTDGKINGPLSSTIIDNLSGANLTALDPDAVTNSAVTFDSGSVTLADNGVGTITGNVGNYILFVLTGETDERNMNIAFVDTANEDIILHHTSEDGSQRWSTSAGGADMWNLYFSSNSLILQNTRDDCGGGCTVDWFLIKAT